MAGLGESCSHAAALLFTVDIMVKLRDSTTVTPKTACWKQPAFKDIAYFRAHEMDFTSSQKRKTMLDNSLAGTSKQTITQSAKTVPALTTDQVENVFRRIQFSNSKVKPAILSLVQGYENDYVSAHTVLPAVLVKLKKEELDSKMSVTAAQANLAEEKTKPQTNCKLWHRIRLFFFFFFFRLRLGTVTASQLHSVCHTNPDNPSKAVLKKICCPSSFKNEAVNWGRQKEGEARRRYTETMHPRHTHFSVRQCGLYISPEHSYIGASPDGICQCDCCGTGCLEIKCPYSSRFSTVEDAMQKEKNFCIYIYKEANGLFQLKKQQQNTHTICRCSARFL